MTPARFNTPPPDEVQAKWPHPDNAPEPAIARHRQAQCVAGVRVVTAEFDGASNLWTVTGEDVTGHMRAEWLTRVAPAMHDPYWIWRLGNGDVYAVGEHGEQLQLTKMESSNVPLGQRDDRPFEDPEPDLVKAAQAAADELGVGLEFRPKQRPTSAVLITGRGEIDQHFTVDWPTTLHHLGLELPDFPGVPF